MIDKLCLCYMYDVRENSYVNPTVYPNLEECVSSVKRSVMHEYFTGNMPEIEVMSRTFKFVVVEIPSDYVLEALQDRGYYFDPFKLPEMPDLVGDDDDQ